jgi:hypothetical protein
MFKIYLVKENADKTEGRGPMVTIAAFKAENDAWLYADKFGVGVQGARPASGSWRTVSYGVSYGGDVYVEALDVAESYSEMAAIKKQAVIDQALAKLSNEEIEALGLKRP